MSSCLITQFYLEPDMMNQFMKRSLYIIVNEFQSLLNPKDHDSKMTKEIIIVQKFRVLFAPSRFFRDSSEILDLNKYLLLHLNPYMTLENVQTKVVKII